MTLLQISFFGKGGLDPTQIGAQDIFSLILTVVDIALRIIGGVAVIYIMVAGIQYMTAAGDEKKQSEAKGTIQGAVIGLIVAALAFVIVGTLLRQLKFKDTILEESKPVQNLFQDATLP